MVTTETYGARAHQRRIKNNGQESSACRNAVQSKGVLKKKKKKQGRRRSVLPVGT